MNIDKKVALGIFGTVLVGVFIIHSIELNNRNQIKQAEIDQLIVGCYYYDGESNIQSGTYNRRHTEKVIKENKHAGYRNTCIGYPIGKHTENKKVDAEKGYLIGYIGEDSLGGVAAGGYDTVLSAYPNVVKMQKSIKRKYKLRKCFILSVTSYSSKERELFWKSK